MRWSPDQAVRKQAFVTALAISWQLEHSIFRDFHTEHTYDPLVAKRRQVSDGRTYTLACKLRPLT